MSASPSQRSPTSRTKVQLPKIKEQLGPPIKLNFVKVYAPRQGVVLKAHVDNGDAPQLFVDLEHPRGDFEQMRDTELHLGFSARFRAEPIRNSKVKVHIDAYIPKSEIFKLLRTIVQANLIRRDNRHQAPVGSTSGDPPTFRESAKVGVSGQREKGDAGSGTPIQSSEGSFSGSGSRSVRNCLLPGPAPQARRGEG